MYIKVVMNLVYFNNKICKNFDTEIYRPTSLHVPSRLSRIGLYEVAKRRANSRFEFLFSTSGFAIEGVGSQENAKMTL